MEAFSRPSIEIFSEENPLKNISELFYIARRMQSFGNGLYSERIRICNNTDHDYRISIVYRVQTEFVPEQWLIPCVMYNGNPFGSRNSPKGLTCNGKPWIFASDRSGIPACTLSENEAHVFALFASDDTPAMLNCSCSIECGDMGKYIHKLIYPRTEAPLCYTGKNIMREGSPEYLPLPSGSSFEFCCYLFSDRPKWKNFGYTSLLPQALRVLHHEHLPAMDTSQVKKVCLDYLKYTRNTVKGTLCFSADCRDYTHPIGNDQTGGAWDGLTLEMIEKNPSLNRMMLQPCGMGMGFSSQGIMILRMLLSDALEQKNDALKDEVLGILEKWIALQRSNGLVTLWYPDEREEADPSSLGWGMGEAAKIYALLRSYGIERPDFLQFSCKLADFFAEHFDEADPFGRYWSLDGTKLISGGCNGSFVVKALLEIYEVCHDRRYLLCAQKAYEAFFRRDLQYFRCSAGAIDCDSVDKESSFPFIYCGLALWKALGEKKYLDMAEQSATYFLSWMFCYDVAYDSNTDFSRMGYFTSGGTVVSAEHQCIDPYASVAVPDLLDLSKATGNPVWKICAKMIWANVTQCLAGENGMNFHGMHRPAGTQNECFAQTTWTKYRSQPQKSRGHMNDFLGIWLCCFKLYAIERMDFEEDDENINSNIF